MVEEHTKHIYTVSKLTKEIKFFLEDRYPFIWVIGEISNYRVPSSGHSYFTLKDQQAVINCVMFKNQKRMLRFEPETGMRVIGMARLTLYEPRGSYQLIFEHLEPEGTGSMQVAFEQLKKKLFEKGFFDNDHKKAIPFLPALINIITSGTGAAVKDIITVAERRFPNCCLEIFPVKVQGPGAENEICNAITLVNQINNADLIILARGGGSLEDLSAFNSETVATAIFDSHIPIISGVGHETDFTIADFVADLRAPTPSAAAELALPDKSNLVQRITDLQKNLYTSLTRKTMARHKTVLDLTSRIKSPVGMVYDLRFKLEECEIRLNTMMNHYVLYNKEKLNGLTNILWSRKPEKKIKDDRQSLKILTTALTYSFQKMLQLLKTNHLELDAKLRALNPEAVLERGYSISRLLFDQKVITDSSRVRKNDLIEVLLFKGRLITKVEKINDNEKNI